VGSFHWFVFAIGIDELGSSNSHSSWGDSVCVVSARGLVCFDEQLFAIVTTVNSKSGRMAGSMTVHCRDSPR